MSTKRRGLFSLVLSACCVSLSFAPPAQAGRNDNPGIVPIQANAHGQSYGAWAAAWWRWAIAIEAPRNPIADETGEFCALGQKGKVWFLAGTWGNEVHRECTIPKGTALFFPLANNVWAQFKTDPERVNDSETVLLRI